MALLERSWVLIGTAAAKRKEVYPRHLQLEETPAYHTIPYAQFCMVVKGNSSLLERDIFSKKIVNHKL